MAAHTRLIRLAWENNDSFKVDSKLDDGDWLTILDMNENNHMTGVWDVEVTNIILKYVTSKMKDIGDEMKS